MSRRFQGVRVEAPKRIEQHKVGEELWFQFEKFPTTEKHSAPITHIYFSPVEPYHYAVSSGTRVQIYDSSNEVTKTITKFKDVVYGASWRSDGKLIVAGGEFPSVKIFDVAEKSILRSFRTHKGAVHVTRFGADQSQVFTASDDHTSRCYDITSEKEIACLREHNDYIRCGAITQSNPHLWVTGGYDHKILVWDMRSQEVVTTIDQAAPVEDLLLFPSGSIVVSAGENCVKLWDLFAGGKLLHSISNHQKTVTCLAFDGEHSRILTGGLDQRVRVFDASKFEVIHTLTYSAPILSLGISANNTNLAVGMNDGVLSTRNRLVKAKELREYTENREQKLQGSHRYFLKAKSMSMTTTVACGC